MLLFYALYVYYEEHMVRKGTRLCLYSTVTWVSCIFLNHRQLHYFCNSLFRPTTKKTSKPLIADLLWGESTYDQWIVLTKGMLLAQCKTAVSPLLMHWRYCSLALSHQCSVKRVSWSCWHHHCSMGSYQKWILTHWGQVTHICIGKLTIIGSDNGLLPGRCQAIIWTSAGILLIGPLGTNFSEISIGIQTLSFKKMHLKISSAKWRPFCLSLNVLISLGYGLAPMGNQV